MFLFARKVTESALFKYGILLTIISSAILTGLETYSGILNKYEQLFLKLDRIIILIFTIEIILKLLAQGKNPKQYFRDPWNIFDFIIVVLCYLPSDLRFVSMLRIVRLLRVLRLISVLPKLQLLVNTLIKSLPSISYVIILLTLLFYIYAVAGCFIFGQNDPIHFGSLHVAMLTLFSVVTLEGWVEILKINMYGCANYGYENYSHLCQSSNGQPAAAVIYFITFILLGSMIFINLFIGVVMNSMSESEREMALLKVKSKNSSDLIENLKSIEQKMDLLKNDFIIISDKIKNEITKSK